MDEPLQTAKEANFERFKQEFAEEAVVCRSLPVQIWLETTTRCNLKCRVCPRRYSEGARGEDMSPEVFRRVEEALFPTLKHVELQGWGEPLIAENFETFYDGAQRHGVRVSFITNGTRLTRPWLERFVGDDVGLMLSVDGAREPTMRDLRGVDLGRIEQSIREYNEIKAAVASSRSNLHIVFVAIRQNIDELPELVERAARDWKAVSLLVVHLERQGLPPEMQAQHLENDPQRADAVFAESFELARRLGLMLELPPLFGTGETAGRGLTEREMAETAEKQSYHYCDLGLFRSTDPNSAYPNRCPDPWLKTYIDIRGNVQPCCAYPRVFGNLLKQPFEAIWNGPLYQRLRRKIHSRVPPLSCRECNLIYGITGGNPAGCFARLGWFDRAIVRAQRLKRDWHIRREQRALDTTPNKNRN